MTDHIVDTSYYRIQKPHSLGWTAKTADVIAGCTPNGPECDNCSSAAEELEPPHRTRIIGPRRTLAVYDGTTAQPRWTGDVRIAPREEWAALLDGKGSELVCLASDSDLFHRSVPDSVLLFAFRLMHLAYWNIWQICTTRALRMGRFMSRLYERDGMLQLSPIPLPAKYQVDLENVWIGVSAGTQRTADARLPHLLKVKTSVRFAALQPLLERVDISPYIQGIDWVLAGGEFERNGNYRTMHLDWARAVRDLCVARQVPFFFTHRACTVRNGAMSYLDNALWRQLPRRELAAAPTNAERMLLCAWARDTSMQRSPQTSPSHTSSAPLRLEPCRQSACSTSPWQFAPSTPSRACTSSPTALAATTRSKPSTSFPSSRLGEMPSLSFGKRG